MKKRSLGWIAGVVAVAAAACGHDGASGGNGSTSTDGGATDGAANADGATTSSDASADGSGVAGTGVVFPANSGVINVKDYGAVGDGIHDDTAAIVKAIRMNVGIQQDYWKRDRIIYFPDGTYLVSNTTAVFPGGDVPYGILTWLDAQNYWVTYLQFQGQSEAGTKILLANGLFPKTAGTCANTVPIIYTASGGCANFCTAGDGGTSNDTSHNPQGEGNAAFRNHIRNLTLDVGTGNPCAVGIDYLGNNNTRVSDVTITSDDLQGAIGLELDRGDQGPELIKNVTVNGFAKGIQLYGTANVDHGVWFEHVTLANQTVTGIDMPAGVASFRDLESNNTVTALQVSSYQGATQSPSTVSLTIVDSTLNGGDAANTAIVDAYVAGQDNPKVFLRNVTSKGYANLLTDQGTTYNKLPVSNEWSSNPPLQNPASSATVSLNLDPLGTPGGETPTFVDDNFANWISVTDYGAVADTTTVSKDNTAAIQAAIDYAALHANISTIYIPWGKYSIGSAIHLHGSVKRLLCIGCELRPLNAGSFTGNSALVIDTASAPTVFVDGLVFDDTVTNKFSHVPVIQNNLASTTTLVLTNMENISYANTAGAGPVYMESVAFGPFYFDHETAYLRHLNPELDFDGGNTNATPHVRNNGGNVWIFGLKTENRSGPDNDNQVFLGENGSTTEILGARIYSQVRATTYPMMQLTDTARGSFTSLSTGLPAIQEYTLWIEEDRATTFKLNCNGGGAPQAYSRGNASVIPLYLGY
jgi:Pectate lyase superfamily protein